MTLVTVDFLFGTGGMVGAIGTVLVLLVDKLSICEIM
jgi:hypothetical protein